MRREMTLTSIRAFLGCGVLLISALAMNCSEQKQADTANTQPGGAESERTSAPAPTDPSQSVEIQPATRPESPATRPATRPEAEQPVSTYDSKPPYTVSLYVKDPKEKQPGWLRIDELASEKPLATATGRFPEQNRIYIDTGNVRRIRVHVGHLPLRPNERVIVQIDGQGMVISRTRPFTTLQLSPTGQWQVLKED